MNNIFKNAYFGKQYKTRDGRKAIYAYKCEGRHYLIVEYYEHIFTWNDNGVSDAPVQKLDIVSEWQEEINEEELDKLAENIVDTFLISDYTEGRISYERLKNLVKAGYRKAMKNKK